MIHKLRTGHELFDAATALQALLAGLGQERPGFFGCWRNSNEIQIDAAQELCVGGNLRRKGFNLLQLGIDMTVDIVVLRELRPLESRTPFENRNRQGDKAAFV